MAADELFCLGRQIYQQYIGIRAIKAGGDGIEVTENEKHHAALQRCVSANALQKVLLCQNAAHLVLLISAHERIWRLVMSKNLFVM